MAQPKKNAVGYHPNWIWLLSAFWLESHGKIDNRMQHPRPNPKRYAKVDDNQVAIFLLQAQWHALWAL